MAVLRIRMDPVTLSSEWILWGYPSLHPSSREDNAVVDTMELSSPPPSLQGG